MEISFLLLFSFISFLIFSHLSRPIEEDSIGYATSSLLTGTFLWDAYSQTGKYELGTKVEQNKESKSNINIARKKFESWRNENAPNTESSIAIITKFICDHPIKFIAMKVLNPILFFSLASTELESLFNLVFSTIVIIFFIFEMKALINQKIKWRNMIGLHILFLCIIGYSTLFWVSFSYARYSMPIMFLILPFSINRFFSFRKNLKQVI
jgi:hypothetical protein